MNLFTAWWKNLGEGEELNLEILEGERFNFVSAFLISDVLINGIYVFWRVYNRLPYAWFPLVVGLADPGPLGLAPMETLPPDLGDPAFTR